MYGKATVGLLIYMIDKWVFGSYCVLSIAIFILFPQPKYEGPDSLHFFTPAIFDEIIIRNKGKIVDSSSNVTNQSSKNPMWLVEFYASWSPPCVHVEPVIADISLKYVKAK